MSKDFGKGSRQKRKKCVKPTAYPCKYACILKTKNCRNPLKGQAKTAVLWVADQERRLAEVNKKRAEKGRSALLASNGKLVKSPSSQLSDRPTTKLIKTDNHAEIKQILEDGTNGTLEQLQAREKRADKLRDTLLDEIKSIENQHRLFTDSEINWFNKKGFEDISRKIQGTGGVYIYEDGEYKLRGISKAQKGVGYGPRASATKEGPTGTFVIKDLSDNSTRSVYGSDILRNDTPNNVLQDLLNKRQFRKDLLKVSKEIENKIFQLQSEPNSADELAARRKPTQEQTGSKVVSLSDRQVKKDSTRNSDRGSIIPHEIKEEGQVIKNYPDDLSASDDFKKYLAKGDRKNIFGDTLSVRSVPAHQMRFEDYKDAWKNFTGSQGYTDDGVNKNVLNYKKAIDKAIAEGKAIHPDVMKDYNGLDLSNYKTRRTSKSNNSQPAKPKDIETLTAEEARLGKELDAILNKYTGKKTTAQQEEINKAKEAYIKANKALREAKKNQSSGASTSSITPIPKKEEKKKSSQSSFDTENTSKRQQELEEEARKAERQSDEHLMAGYTTSVTRDIWQNEGKGLERQIKRSMKEAEIWKSRPPSADQIAKQKKKVAAEERKEKRVSDKQWLDDNVKQMVFEGPHKMMPSFDYQLAILKAMEGDGGKALQSYYNRRRKEIDNNINRGVDVKKAAYHNQKAFEYEVQKEDLLKAAKQLKSGMILGVKLTGDYAKDYNVVKSAYRKLAKQHHPDVGGDAAKFRQVQAEWETFDKGKPKDFSEPLFRHRRF